MILIKIFRSLSNININANLTKDKIAFENCFMEAKRPLNLYVHLHKDFNLIFQTEIFQFYKKRE